jgi:hypothetical protein
MIRSLGATSLGDGSVDIDGDGIGDYCPTGDCEYDSPDKDTSDDLKKTAKALEILSKLIDFLKNLLKFKADSDLQKKLNDAEKKLNDGKQKMMDEANKLNSNFENLQISNQNLQTQLGDLTNVTDSITSQLSAITSLTSSINGLDATMASQSLAIADSQARLDQALNRANYPLGIDGLRQQRTDIRGANFDLMNNSMALNSSQETMSNLVTQRNSVGDAYNSNLNTASGLRSDISQTYGQAQTFQNAMNNSLNNYNQGASTYSSGMNDARGAVSDYRGQMNTGLTLNEGARGVEGASRIINAVADGKTATAIGEAMASGVQALARNGGPAELSMAQALIASGLQSAGNAVDRGGTTGEIATNLVRDFGQATIRVNDMQKAGMGIETGLSIMGNTRNPDRIYDGAQLLAQQVGPLINVSGAIVGTASNFVPGLQGSSVAITQGAQALAVAGQGSAQIAVEAVNRFSQSGISAPTGNYPDRGIGRGLVTRAEGGPASPGTITLAGAVATLGSTARQIVGGQLNSNRDFALQASATVNAIANTGMSNFGLKPQLRTGSVTFGLRPGTSGGGVIAGD